MFRSVITRRTSELIFPSASRPSHASITPYPAPFNVKETIWRTLTESSTVRIVLLMPVPVAHRQVCRRKAAIPCGIHENTPRVPQFEAPLAGAERPVGSHDQLQARKIDRLRRTEIQNRIAGRRECLEQCGPQLRRAARIEFAPSLDTDPSAGFLKPYVHTIDRSK